MTLNFEKVIELIQQLPPTEQDKVLQWLEEKRKPRPAGEDRSGRVEKFHLALRWIDAHRQEFLGKWLCLDGDRLVSFGKDAKEVYREAKSKGVEIPFIEQVREEETALFWGGWD